MKKNTHKHLPSSLTHVTAFSKLLAFLLIIAFIACAFYAGIMFNQQYSVNVRSITPTPTAVPALH